MIDHCTPRNCSSCILGWFICRLNITYFENHITFSTFVKFKFLLIFFSKTQIRTVENCDIFHFRNFFCENFNKYLKDGKPFGATSTALQAEDIEKKTLYWRILNGILWNFRARRILVNHNLRNKKPLLKEDKTEILISEIDLIVKWSARKNL